MSCTGTYQLIEEGVVDNSNHRHPLNSEPDRGAYHREAVNLRCCQLYAMGIKTKTRTKLVVPSIGLHYQWHFQRHDRLNRREELLMARDPAIRALTTHSTDLVSKILRIPIAHIPIQVGSSVIFCPEYVSSPMLHCQSGSLRVR